MSLKDKILNRLADNLKKYRTPEYDYILSCDISGEVKGAFMTTDCSTIKEIENISNIGLIDVKKLLDDEFDNSENYHIKEIIFCDKENSVCLYNSKNDSYYEDVHEFFERAENRIYVRCNSTHSYETFKNYVNQSSKYHDYIKYEYEVPRKKAFDKIFEEKENNFETKLNKNNNLKNKDNYIQITGKISNIGKCFTKSDGDKAQFIEIKQEYKYNNKTKYNKISVLIPNNLLDSVSKMNEDKTISIKGKLNTYYDKNNNSKSVINCTDIEILENSKTQNNEFDINR